MDILKLGGGKPCGGHAKRLGKQSQNLMDWNNYATQSEMVA